MSEQHDGYVGAQFIAPASQVPTIPQTTVTQSSLHCDLTAEGHCITCSDEALPAKVLSIDSITGLALVAVEDITEEIDVSLVDDVSPGDMVLVHGGVAIAHLEEVNDE